MTFFRKLRCAIFGHKYRVHQHFTAYSRRVVCDCCGGDWAMHDELRVITQWNGEFDAMYTLLGHTVKPREPRATSKETQA